MINKSGNLNIDCHFNEVYNFPDALAFIKNGDKYSFIKCSGN
ncbi:MAG: WG repeat-containing protein [Bacteroidales bacterium]|nr:WG repeat-containing protein [Bacteroidales bacterium]